MGVEILTLSENTVQKQGLIAEHGLCFLIRTGQGAVLFDTGQGLVARANAAEMEIDLREVGCIVLSHGHFDHTGGLRGILERTGPRQVIAHPNALKPKFSVRDGKVRAIGVSEGREALERSGAQFRLAERPSEVLPGVTATGCIPRKTDFEEVGARFQTGCEGALAQDMLWDDQALIVETGEGPAVVLGCAHAGLINTLLYASELTGEERFAAVIGGTHLIDADALRIQNTLEALGQFDIGRMAPCHCTGFCGQKALSEAFGERFALNTVGDRVEFQG